MSHAENRAIEEWLTYCSGTWHGRDTYYSVVGGLFTNRYGHFFFKGEVTVHELDKGFNFIKRKHFFIMFSNLYNSFYKPVLLLQTSCAAFDTPGMR